MSRPTPARLLITKGAFHHVLDICTRSADGASSIRRRRRVSRRAIRRGANRGFGCSRSRHEPSRPGRATAGRSKQDLIVRRIPHLLRPAEADAADAIRSLAALGVSVKIITGDCKPVTQHVAALVGLRADRVLTGADLQRLSDEALWRAAENTDLFVEVDPNQKERIILAVKKMGHVVGFLGDGVNDAPAMHAADTSLSVEQAVDVAKAAADFVLLERRTWTSFAGASRRAATTFANTLKYVLTTMSANLGNMISMAAASLFLPFLPLLAGQILLNNLLSDVPAIGIADDAVDPELIAQPQRWDMGFIGRFMVAFGAGQLALRLSDLRRAAAGLPVGAGTVSNRLVRRIAAHRAGHCAGRADAAPVLSQPAGPPAAVVDTRRWWPSRSPYPICRSSACSGLCRCPGALVITVVAITAAVRRGHRDDEEMVLSERRSIVELVAQLDRQLSRGGPVRARERVLEPGQVLFVGNVGGRESQRHPAVQCLADRDVGGRMRRQMVGAVAEQEAGTEQDRARDPEALRQVERRAAVERHPLVVVEEEVVLVGRRLEVGHAARHGASSLRNLIGEGGVALEPAPE